MDYIFLAALLILWCTVHSAMISITVTRYLKNRWGRRYRFYRLFFNLAALVTLLPILFYRQSLQDRVLFRWEGFLVIFQILLLAGGILLVLAGVRHYDMLQFLGLRQIRTNNSHSVLSESGTFNTTGVLGLTRHPWYLAGMLLIWARDLDPATLVTNVILTIYLVLGTLLEERKLLMEYGEAYRTYQRRVSMLIPFKWFNSFFR